MTPLFNLFLFIIHLLRRISADSRRSNTITVITSQLFQYDSFTLDATERDAFCEMPAQVVRNEKRFEKFLRLKSLMSLIVPVLSGRKKKRKQEKEKGKKKKKKEKIKRF